MPVRWMIAICVVVGSAAYFLALTVPRRVHAGLLGVSTALALATIVAAVIVGRSRVPSAPRTGRGPGGAWTPADGVRAVVKDPFSRLAALAGACGMLNFSITFAMLRQAGISPNVTRIAASVGYAAAVLTAIVFIRFVTALRNPAQRR